MADINIKYIVHNDYIDIYVPLTSQGKFRCKTRNNFQEYGIGFAPKSDPIPKNAYVEWQIGYDKIIGKDGKKTRLENITFEGANGKTKCLYELSEILYFLCKKELVSKNKLKELKNRINNMHDYLQDMYKIKTDIDKMININDEDFYKSVITLPTFDKKNDSCDIVTQISIEKQQYATGVQPMLYMTIPVTEFLNADRIIGNTSKVEEYGILRIDRNKVDVIENIFLCFGMCSESHHKDIISILEKIEENI